MAKEFITIQEASEISGKSIQTIRRAIKAKKLLVKRKKTPQGFNYLVNRESLYEFYRMKIPHEQTSKTETTEQKESNIEKDHGKKQVHISSDDFQSFARTMERLISQHAEERQSFLRLVNTMQEKIFFLENQLNLLKSPDKKRWYAFWK